MGKKNVLLATIILFFIAADVSNASFLWNFRKLIDSAPKGSPNETVSPMPSPTPGSNSIEDNKPKDKQVTVDNTSVTSHNDKKVNSNTTTPTGHKENKTNDQVKGGEGKSDAPVGSNQTCNGIDGRCRDSKSMVACIKSYDDVSKILVLLIQNQGNSSFKVNITYPASMGKSTKIEMLKHQSQEVNISVGSVSNGQILLNAGNGDCVLHFVPLFSEGNPFNWLPPYSKFLTPIYGAYVLLLATLIAGGLWVCCMFRRRKQHGEIPYQELEMGLPETSLGVETADGWDQGWDDDWDEDKAVKSPGARHPGSISANGLTSRSANRDGWEDWDD